MSAGLTKIPQTAVVFKKSLGLALDIDGVFLRGGKAIKNASKALQAIHENKIPHVFMTNGGGCLEETKAKELSKSLGVDVHPSQILLSHTPYKSISPNYSNSRVLVLGHEGCIEVAKNYGFNKVSTAVDILKESPSIFPQKKYYPPSRYGSVNGNGKSSSKNSSINSNNNSSSSSSGVGVNHAGEPIAAAFIFHDPQDWALEMQVLTDILLSGKDFAAKTIADAHNQGGTWKQNVPLFSCNPDLIYQSDYPRPRFTQGAFVEAFRTLFEQFTGTPLNVHYCGKPFNIQYNLAEEMIKGDAVRIGLSEVPEQFIGIGDNPLSDIRGANNAGSHWTSILVRTGVFKGDNDELDAAKVVFDDVHDAVTNILKSKQ